MNHDLLTIAASCLGAATLAAQGLSGEFSPNVAPIGAPVAFAITDAAGQGLNLPSPCTWYSIHQGSQTGPVLDLGISCPAVIVPVAPGGSYGFTWDQRDVNGQVPAGRYWIRAMAWSPGYSQQYADWFCLSIVNPGEPVFTVQAPVQLGQTTAFSIAAPRDPGAVYFSALSFSSNNPVTVAGLSTCLSLPIFTGLQNGFGVLDGQGNSSGIALTLPNIPALRNLGLHAQAAVFGSSIGLTNDISITLR